MRQEEGGPADAGNLAVWRGRERDLHKVVVVDDVFFVLDQLFSRHVSRPVVVRKPGRLGYGPGWGGR